jgi:hypothetical protein
LTGPEEGSRLHLCLLPLPCINDQFRIVFHFERGEAANVTITDHHHYRQGGPAWTVV